MKQRPDWNDQENINQAREQIGLREIETLFKHGPRASEQGQKRQGLRNSLDLRDLQALAAGLSRWNVTHALFVSHLEVLGPLLKNLARLNPDHFKRANEMQNRQADKNSDAMYNAATRNKQYQEILGEYGVGALEKQLNELEQQMEKAIEGRNKEEYQKLNGLREEIADEYKQKIAQFKEDEHVQKLMARFNAIGNRAYRMNQGKDHLQPAENFTVKIEPNGKVSLIFRGRQHTLVRPAV